MDIQDKVAVVTGGGRGIGRALCHRFAHDGARAVVVVDRDESAKDVASALGGMAVVADVGIEAEVVRVVATALDRHGRIDLFCSNAGIGGGDGSLETPASEWQQMWQVNLMAHVHAARAVLPAMLAAGRGYLLHTASAAGLLTQIGSAPYAVTKHAAVAFAEWLAVTYGARGITVSCLCPQGVQTAMLDAAGPAARGLLAGSAIRPEAVAEAVMAGLAAERFLILPHPEVEEYYRRKAADYDRWLRGMRRLQQRLAAE